MYCWESREVSIALPGKQGGKKGRISFSIHNFSQLFTKPPALQAPGSPELEDSKQPARAFCSIPRLSARKLSLPGNSEQTVGTSFSSTQREGLFVCSPSLWIKQKTKVKGEIEKGPGRNRNTGTSAVSGVLPLTATVPGSYRRLFEWGQNTRPPPLQQVAG